MITSIVAAIMISQTGQLVSGFCPVGIGCPKVVPVKVLSDGSVITSGGGGGGTVDQGLGGLSPWLMVWTTPGPVTQSGTWTVQQGTPPWSVSGTVTSNQGGAPWSVTFPVAQAVTGPLTDGQLRAAPVPVSGNVTATGPLTDAQLRALAVPVSGTVTSNQGGAPWSVTFPVAQAVTGPLTDAQLRATPVPVSGTVSAAITSTTVANASNTGTCTSVTVSTTVLAANASRKVASIYNSPNSTANVHVKLGAVATTSNPPIVPGQSVNIEAATIYTGIVDVIAASGTQTVCVYEW